MLQYLRQDRAFYKMSFSLLIPIILQNIITQSLMLADTFMVGAVGEADMASVTVANTPFFLLNLICFGIQSGACVLIAQYKGRGDMRTINRVLGVALGSAVLITSVVAIVAFLMPRTIMTLLTNSEDMIEAGAKYIRIIGFANVFGCVSSIYIGIQRSVGNARLGMYVFSSSGLLNIGLNYILIFGKLGFPALGVAGAALATLICRVLESVFVVIYAARNPYLPLMPKLFFRPGILIFKDFIRYALPVMINEFFWSLGTSLYSVIMGHMMGSTQIMAAYTIAGNLDRLLTTGIYAAGATSAIIVGQEIGRGDTETVYAKAAALNMISTALGLFSTLLLLSTRFLLAESVIYPIMDMSAESIRIANYMLILMAIIVPFRALCLSNIVGAFRGGGDVRFAMLVDILPMYVFALPLSALCGLVFGLGIEIVYLCMLSDELIKVFITLIRFRSKRWINNVTRSAEEMEAAAS